MENKKKKVVDLKNPKTLVMLNLAVAAATVALLPDNGSAGDYYKECKVGDKGDCQELTSSGTMVCTVGSFWNDCN